MKVKDLINKLCEFPMDDEVKVDFVINQESYFGRAENVRRENNGPGKVHVAIETDLTLIPKVTFEE